MKILRYIYTVSVLVPLTVIFTLIAIVVWPFDLLERQERLSKGLLGRGGTWVKINWNKMILWTHRIKIRIDGPGAPLLKELKGVVFVANHQSVLDIPAVITSIAENSSWLAKKELARIPFFGWAAVIVGTFFIDRSKGSRETSLAKLNSLIKSGISAVIFPEGTRSADGNLLPFKRGAFVMAIENQTPIVPLTISGSRQLCPKGELNLRSGEIRIFADLPIPTIGLTLDDRIELSDRVKSLIAKRLTYFFEQQFL